jgi:hypothetical protein
MMAERKESETVRCPSCKGNGLLGGFSTEVLGGRPACLWCKGTKRVAHDVAVRYADQTYALAGGGYICGDHDLQYARTMEAEAEAIYASMKKQPPWRSETLHTCSRLRRG